jgi:predicted HicB family RNase H-like nuclease
MFKIDNELKSANIARTVRFTESLFEKLNQTAQENNVSFNLLVLQCCKYALENMEDK